MTTPWVLGTRPFAATSPINTPLPANVSLAPLPWPAPAGGNYWNIVKFPTDIPAADAPVVAINQPGYAWQYPPGIFNRQMTAGFNHNGSDSDNEIISIVGTDCLSAWLFNRTSDTTATCAARGSADLVTGSGFGTLPHNAAGILASGQNPMAGALFKEEFTANASIDHVIAICLLFNLVNSGPPKPPAIGNDGSSTGGFAVEGDMLAIARSTPMPAGLSVFGKKIFVALQNYGAIVCDKGGANQFYLGTSYNNPSGSWTYDDILGSPAYVGPGLYWDGRAIIPLLQKVVMTTALVQDNFVDADGVDLASHKMDIGAGWTDLVGSHFIQSGSAQPNTLVGGKAFSVFASPANGTYSLTMTAVLNLFPCLIFRLSDVSNYYIFQFGNDGVGRLSRVVAGAPGVTLATSTVKFVLGTAYQAVVTFQGDVITISVNGEKPISVSSAFNDTATKCGIRSASVGSGTGKNKFSNLIFTT
jgi:hypothetical protein